VLPASLRTAESPYSNCLFYANNTCDECIARCPAGAITEKGHDKAKCRAYQHGIGYSSNMEEYDDNVSVAGCGLWAVASARQRYPANLKTQRRN